MGQSNISVILPVAQSCEVAKKQETKALENTDRASQVMLKKNQGGECPANVAGLVRRINFVHNHTCMKTEDIYH